MYLDFVLKLTRLFWRSCEWQVIDFEPYDTGSNRKKIYDNKKTHPSIMFMNVLLAGQQHLLPFYQRFHLGIFFQLWWQNWGLFTPSFFFSMSVSPITIPPFLSLFLPELCIYIVTVVHVLEYIYAIVRPKLSSMYRDHRFLYVEPSSVYLHLYGTIYTVFMPLWCLFRILFYCYISDYPYACEEFWIVALSLHLGYQVLLIFKKYVGLNMNL